MTFKKNKEYRGENVLLESIRKDIPARDTFDSAEEYAEAWFEKFNDEADKAEEQGLTATAKELRIYSVRPHY